MVHNLWNIHSYFYALYIYIYIIYYVSSLTTWSIRNFIHSTIPLPCHTQPVIPSNIYLRNLLSVRIPFKLFASGSTFRNISGFDFLAIVSNHPAAKDGIYLYMYMYIWIYISAPLVTRKFKLSIYHFPCFSRSRGHKFLPPPMLNVLYIHILMYVSLYNISPSTTPYVLILPSEMWRTFKRNVFYSNNMGRVW